MNSQLFISFLGTPASNMVLVAASYCQVNLQHQECQGDMILQWDGKLTSKTPLSILNYICEKSPNLLGKNKAQILQWVMYSLGMNKTLLYSYFFKEISFNKILYFVLCKCRKRNSKVDVSIFISLLFFPNKCLSSFYVYLLTLRHSLGGNHKVITSK